MHKQTLNVHIFLVGGFGEAIHLASARTLLALLVCIHHAERYGAALPMFAKTANTHLVSAGLFGP